MTIGGGANIHTIAELSDLLAAKDPEIPALEKNWNDFHPVWAQANPAADAKFKRDLDALKSRYGAATFALHTVIDAVPSFMENITPAEQQYQIVLTSLQKTSGVVSPGDLQELWNRLTAARNAAAAAQGQPPPKPMYEPPVFQPRSGSDVEETFLKDTAWVDPLVHAVDPTRPEGKKTYGWIAAILAVFGIGYLYVKSRPSVVVVAPRAEKPALEPKRASA